jgi:hypothetical protein
LGTARQTEAASAAGGALDVGEFTTATNTLRRLLNDLGLERWMRDITPSIDAYLKGPKRQNGPV